jgi:predicted flavoprotein YhiN
VLDASRHWLVARATDREASVAVAWLPDIDPGRLDAELRELGPAGVGRFLARRLPERMAAALCAHAGLDPALPGHRLTREGRRALVEALTGGALPVSGDRGWNEAEATAGGVALAEGHPHPHECRRAPGLHLCGEVLDVDGRIGGFNFQWAWASGYVAGVSLFAEPSQRTQ